MIELIKQLSFFSVFFWIVEVVRDRRFFLYFIQKSLEARVRLEGPVAQHLLDIDEGQHIFD